MSPVHRLIKDIIQLVSYILEDESTVGLERELSIKSECEMRGDNSGNRYRPKSTRSAVQKLLRRTSYSGETNTHITQGK